MDKKSFKLLMKSIKQTIKLIKKDREKRKTKGTK